MMKRQRTLFLYVTGFAVLSILLCLPGCQWLFGEDSSEAQGQQANPERIVTVGGVVTEIVFALGQGENVVGVDKTSIYPPEALKHAKPLPYFRMMNAESILALEPTVVIAVEEAGPKHAIDQLRKAGVRVELIPTTPSTKAAVDRIQKIGELIGAKDEAQKLVTDLNKKLAALELDQCKSDTKVMFIYARNAALMMVAGKNTPGHAAIELAGAKNAFDDTEGFKPINPEAVIAAAPDVVLMGEQSVNSLGGDESLWKLGGLSETPAGKAKRLVSMDLLLLLGFGPRLDEAMAKLTKDLGTCP